MKRRFFQIHLLTAVVGMLVAGGLVGVNVQPTSVDRVCCSGSSKKRSKQLYAVPRLEVGWPYVIASRTYYAQPFLEIGEKNGLEDLSRVEKSKMLYVSKASYEQLLAAQKAAALRTFTWNDVLQSVPEVRESGGHTWPIKELPRFQFEDAEIQPRAVVINIAVTLSIFLATMIGIEWFLRRRERARV